MKHNIHTLTLTLTNRADFQKDYANSTVLIQQAGGNYVSSSKLTTPQLSQLQSQLNAGNQSSTHQHLPTQQHNTLRSERESPSAANSKLSSSQILQLNQQMQNGPQFASDRRTSLNLSANNQQQQMEGGKTVYTNWDNVQQQGQGSPVIQKKEYADSLQLLSNEQLSDELGACFHGDIPRQDAEKLLLASDKDSYLIRSSKKGSLVLTVLNRLPSKTITHWIIIYGNNTFGLQNSSDTTRYMTMTALITNTPLLRGFSPVMKRK